MDHKRSSGDELSSMLEEVCRLDKELTTAAGIVQAQLAARKTELLREMLRLSTLFHQERIRQFCEQNWTRHIMKFPDTVGYDVASSETEEIKTAAEGLSEGDVGVSALVDAVGQKEETQGGGRSRLSNVPPKTADQVIDKKVCEKVAQVDRACVQLGTMTTPTSAEGKFFPRYKSFVIHYSECEPNSGGGNRTKINSAEKHRSRPVILIRPLDGSFVNDVTAEKIFALVWRKIKQCRGKLDGEDIVVSKRMECLEYEGWSSDIAVIDSFAEIRKYLFENGSRSGRKRKANVKGGLETKKRRQDREEVSMERSVNSESTGALYPYSHGLGTMWPPLSFGQMRPPMSYPVAFTGILPISKERVTQSHEVTTQEEGSASRQAS